MIQQHSQFDAQVRRCLEQWGREFSLDQDMEPLGHQSKNILQVMVEHDGEVPGRVTGFKPLYISPNAQMVEDCMLELWRAKCKPLVLCMRARWCGWGRVGVERYELAQALISQHCPDGGHERFSRRTFYSRLDFGHIEVAQYAIRTGHFR